MFRKTVFGLLLSLVFALTGCHVQPINGSSSVSANPESITEKVDAAPRAYILKPSDPLFIRFGGIMDQQPLEDIIDEKGEINLLHLEEPIKAAGLTASALENKIERLYIDGGIYRNVSVNVTMTAKVFFVQGEVLAAGQFPLQSGTTLVQAIAAARGYTPFAWKTRVTVTRHGKVYRFNMKEVEKDPSKDVKIQAGDVIKVPQKPW